MADSKSESKAAVNRSDDAEKEVKGSKSAGGYPVSVPDASNTEAQDRALLNYKVTGVVGDYVDPTRDQEWDIAPEFGVAPHPELHNVAVDSKLSGKSGLGVNAPTEAGYGGNPAAAEKALPQKEKQERAKELDKQTGDRPVSERLAAGRPDLRGNEGVNAKNTEAVKQENSKDKDK